MSQPITTSILKLWNERHDDGSLYQRYDIKNVVHRLLKRVAQLEAENKELKENR